MLELQAPTINACTALYVLVGLQPLFTVNFFMLSVAMYHVPIVRGFGKIAVFAGFDRQSLDELAGAGFSGFVKVRSNWWG